MRVFLDTNVLASAFATRGLCEDVVRETLAFHEWVVSKTVLSELQRVLREKLGVPQPTVDEVLSFLLANAETIDQADLLQLKVRDRADQQILSEAAAANVDVFVTGDKELLELGKIGELRLISPRVFWESVLDQK